MEEYFYVPLLCNFLKPCIRLDPFALSVTKVTEGAAVRILLLIWLSADV